MVFLISLPIRLAFYVLGTVLGTVIGLILPVAGALVKWLFGIKADVIEGTPYVVDGDGLAFDGDIRIRLFGLDAPEMDHPEGKPSKDYLTQLVQNGPIRVVAKSTDKYGRIVGVAYDADGQDLNARMVADGYARAYSSFSKAYTHLEKKAKRKGYGLWANGGLAIHPEIWRQAQR